MSVDVCNCVPPDVRCLYWYRVQMYVIMDVRSTSICIPVYRTAWGSLLVWQTGHCPPLNLKHNFIMGLPPKFLEKQVYSYIVAAPGGTK